MAESIQQCKICYKIKSDLDEKVSRENETDDDRRKLLNLCSEYLFSELCDWKSVSDQESLPFCAECYTVIQKIQILDGELKSHELDISNFSDLFAVKVLRLRKQNVDIFPKVVGGVTIKTLKIEKRVDQEVMCKICHSRYNEGSSNDLLNLAVTKVVMICKKHLFSEIFDEGSLDLDVIVRNNLLPFCFDCCTILKDICQMSDLIQNISAKIEMLVNGFAVKVLKYRKTRKSHDTPIYIPENSFQIPESPTPACGESTNKVLPQTLENTSQASAIEDPILEVPLQNQETNFQKPPAPAVDEAASDNEECMIVDVIADGVEINIIHPLENSKLINLDEDEILKQDSPSESEPKIPNLGEAFCDNELQNSISGGHQSIHETPAGVVENSSVVDLNVNLDEGPPILNAENPSPNRRTSNRSKPAGNFKCEICGAAFLHKHNWLKHIDTCSESEIDSQNSGAILEDANQCINAIRTPVKAYRCPLCKKSFSRAIHLTNHIKSHKNTTENFRPNQKNSIKQILKSNKGSFECSMCQMEFNEKLKFSKHLQTHYDIASPLNRAYENGNYCDLPEGNESQNGGDLQYNPNPLRNKRKYTFSCYVCHKIFKRKYILRCHFLMYHTTPEENQSYDLAPEENIDEDSDNNDPEYSPKRTRGEVAGISTRATKKFRCSICGQRFRRMKILRNHLQSHYDEAPYKCTICKKVLSNKKTLKRHIYSRNHALLKIKG